MAITTNPDDRAKGLVWHDTKRLGQPGTHVLVVGVGQFAKASGMSTLTSPIESARQFAAWFLPGGSFRNDARPLASLSMLLSDPKAVDLAVVSGGPVPRAKFAAMATAMTDLVARAEANPENMLIIYIASHGLGWGDRTGIMFENYKENPQQRRHGMTDTDQLARAMRRVKLERKLVFLDCCRNEAERFEPSEDIGLPVFDPDGDGTITNPALVLRSTIAGAKSYGETGGGPTVFGKALLAALGGLAAQKNENWRVKATNLANVTRQLMELRKRDGKPIQIPQSDISTDFPITTSAPTSTVTLFLSVNNPAPAWVVRCDLPGGETLLVPQDVEIPGHARLDLPAYSDHVLRVTTPDGAPLSEASINLDAPVAFQSIPDPDAVTVELLQGPGNRETTLSITGSAQSVGAAIARADRPDSDRLVSGGRDTTPVPQTAAVPILAAGLSSVGSGRHQVSVTRMDGRVFDLAVTLKPGETVGLNVPDLRSSHEWLMPATVAGVLPVGTLAGADTPGPSPVILPLSAQDAMALTNGKTPTRAPEPGIAAYIDGEDGRFHRFRFQDAEPRRFEPHAVDIQAATLPVWLEVTGENWREIAFLPTLGAEGWPAELLVDLAAGRKSRLVPYVVDDTWGRLLAFLGRRDFPNTETTLKQLGEQTIVYAVFGKIRNPLAATAGVLAAVACGSIISAGLKEAWLENLTNWFVGLPDGPVALGRHRQREGRLDEAREAYSTALSRGVPVFSLSVDWLAEGLESLSKRGEDGSFDKDTEQALRWSRMVDSLQTFTVLRMEGS
jgi:hypothetical protein